MAKCKVSRTHTRHLLTRTLCAPLSLERGKGMSQSFSAAFSQQTSLHHRSRSSSSSLFCRRRTTTTTTTTTAHLSHNREEKSKCGRQRGALLSPRSTFPRQHHHRNYRAAAADDAATATDATKMGGGLRMFVVRHEKRPIEDPTFHVSLTEDGMRDAADVVRATLQSHGITKVYTSPFRRVLQTVQPFLSTSGLKAHVDWALYEHPEPNPEPVTSIPDDFRETFSIESSYEPHVGGDDIAGCNDDFEAVHARVRGLVRRLAESHGESCDEVLLLATHQTSVHSLLHQQSGIPMDCLNVPMGTVVELRWREIITCKE